MAVIEIITSDLQGQNRAYLANRSGSTGTPEAAGYLMSPPVSGNYKLTVDDALTGWFEVWVIGSTGQVAYRGYVDIASTETDNQTVLLPPTPPPVGHGVGLVHGTDGGKTAAATGGAIAGIRNIILPERSQGNTCSASGAQQAGYILPASSDVGLSFPLPGGIVPTWPEGVEPEDDPDLDLSIVPDRMVMFNNPFCQNVVYYGKLQIADGNLLIVPPLQVIQSPAIYNMEVVWTQSDKIYRRESIVSVEQSLLNRALVNPTHGPLTIGRIRTRLRDWPDANDLLDTYEFSAAEICTAMLEAIELYNETPPFSAYFNVTNFPYRQHWIDAVVARLMLTSGYWMMRNQTSIQAEGVTRDSRDKYFRAIQLGQTMWADYSNFVRADKARLSQARGFRSF